jgi:hypothetical protein
MSSFHLQTSKTFWIARQSHQPMATKSVRMCDRNTSNGHGSQKEDVSLSHQKRAECRTYRHKNRRGRYSTRRSLYDVHSRLPTSLNFQVKFVSKRLSNLKNKKWSLFRAETFPIIAMENDNPVCVCCLVHCIYCHPRENFSARGLPGKSLKLGKYLTCYFTFPSLDCLSGAESTSIWFKVRRKVVKDVVGDR